MIAHKKNSFENPRTNHLRQERRPTPVSLYVLLGAALFVFIETFSRLSPILFSLLLILLISLAINPALLWMRNWTGGRKSAAALIVLAFVLVVGLTGWVFIDPLKTSTTKLAQNLP